MSLCLITGGAGNLACQLSWTLAEAFERIVLFDVAAAPVGPVSPGTVFVRGDILDPAQLNELFVRHRPDAVIHLASLLSAKCEDDRPAAWRVNMDGTFSLMETALRHSTQKVLFASSVAAFGGRLPEVLTDDTPQWPDGLYGVAKMAAERLGVYYHRRHGLDFRCLRLPITVSRFAPSGAASALASHAFIEAMRGGKFTFRARPETRMALIYVQDVMHAFESLMAAPAERLTQRVYNLHSMSVTLHEIARAILRNLPGAELQFEPDPLVTALLESWPGEIDGSSARRDWGWSPAFNLERTADHFIADLRNHPAQPAD